MKNVFEHIKEIQECANRCESLCNDMMFDDITPTELNSINHYVRNYFMILEHDILLPKKTNYCDMFAIHQAIKLLDDTEKKQIAQNLIQLLKTTKSAEDGIRIIHSTILSIIYNDKTTNTSIG